MFFDNGGEDEQRLLELLKFKRKAVFNDNDEIFFGIPAFTVSNEKGASIEQGSQANLLNETVDVSSQTRSRKSKEVQTDASENNGGVEANVNFEDVAEMLKLNIDKIEEVINENNRTNAFKNYEVNWSEGGTTITNPFTLSHTQLVKSDDLEVTSVAWTCRGGTICVAYGRYDHESVCNHKGALCTWNIDLIRINTEKPDTCIETPYCISSIATHPEHPGIVAVGLFNGEIFVYDVRQDEPLVASILDKKDIHSDEISVLKWIKDPKSPKKKYYLLSGSRDGKVLVWNALPTKNQLKLQDGFIILLDYLPKQSFKALGTEMGVSSIAVNPEDKDTFIVGCDSGGLFKCSLSSTMVAETRLNETLSVTLKSPVKLAFDPQYGPIYSLSSSPYHRNLFLTCGSDGEVKLYSLLNTSALLRFCPNQGILYSIDWSSTRPCVFACGTHKGEVIFYDLNSTTSNSVEKLKVSQKPVYTLEFNQSRTGYLATGDAAGIVKIWYLSRDLIQTDDYELNVLNDVAETPFER